MTELDSVSPVDGRYAAVARPLSRYFSEAALIRHRLEVEALYLELLCGLPGTGIPRLPAKGKKLLEALRSASPADAARVKTIEKETRHDVKACERFIRERLERAGLGKYREYVHFALTSEDVNSFSYALMLSRGLGEVLLPALDDIIAGLRRLARRHAADPLLARTHGQPAVGTTFGKEFAVFASRLERQRAQLLGLRLQAKLSGAVGNYNAYLAAFPRADWPAFARRFAAAASKGLKIKIEAAPLTTQIEPHDAVAELFDALRRTNTILVGMCQDIWRYISDGLIVQRAVAGEVGSSTMPQKVNPIHFENAEGNLGAANALCGFFSAKLPVSRLQRDLSDSTVERNYGAAFAHSLIAYKSVMEGFSRISVDRAAAARSLAEHPEVYAEAVQTVLRREGVKDPYSLLKELTRGRAVTLPDLRDFVESLPVRPAVRTELKALLSKPYTGLAARLARGK